MLFLPGEAPKRPSADEIIQLILGSGNPSLSEEEFVTEGIKKPKKRALPGDPQRLQWVQRSLPKAFQQRPDRIHKLKWFLQGSLISSR